MSSLKCSQQLSKVVSKINKEQKTKMKKSLFTLSALLVLFVAFQSCTSSSEKVKKAEENVQEANEDLDEANAAYLQDIETYRMQQNAEIDANQKSIDEFRIRIANEKKEVKAQYEKDIAELEQKNTDMKKTVNDYKAEGKDKWDLFKAEFSRDMDSLKQAFKNLGEKSSD